MSNIPTVQKLYAAFQSGDISTIIDQMDEDVELQYTITSPEVPWHQPRRGRADAPKFFEALGALEFSKFQPKRFFESEDMVVVLLDVEMTVKATGRGIAEQDAVHLWHFNSEGQVSKFADKVDTYQHWAAYRGTDE